MTDLAIINAAVLTANPAQPRADALAVSGDRIVAVGSNAQIRALCTARTTVVDAAEATVLPGFNDAHFHIGDGSFLQADCDLSGVSSFEELALRLTSAPGRGEWIVGHNVTYELLPAGKRLTRFDLDRIIEKRPILLFSTDDHLAWANTLALERAGLLGGLAVGPSSEVVMGSDGRALGELRERPAYLPAKDLVPPLSRERKRALLQMGLHECARHGITSIQNMDGDEAQLSLLSDLEQAGELTCRILFPIKMLPESPLEILEESLAWKWQASGKVLRVGMAKFFLDGVIEGRTAFMLEEYAGSSGATGEPNYSPELFWSRAKHADGLGYQIAAHAIGDAAVRMALDCFERLPQANGHRERRHRIEHIEIIAPADVSRFRSCGAIASMQPYHAPLTCPPPADTWGANIGRRRLNRAFCWRDFLNAGVPLAFGSDWPVVTMNPLEGIACAVNRKPYSDDCADHALSLSEAIHAYTAGAAFAEFQETIKGKLVPGMLADIVVLDRSLETAAPQDISASRAVTTIVGGRIIFDAR